VFAALSVAFHGLVLAVVDVSGLSRARVTLGTAPPDQPPAAAEPREPMPSPSCDSDVVLATAARVLYCTSPLGPGDTAGSCMRQALSAMRCPPTSPC
jgi:hypothetical protein